MLCSLNRVSHTRELFHLFSTKAKKLKYIKGISLSGSGGTLECVSVSSRTLASFWSLFMVVIFATYTANLAAYLTVTIIHLPISNLEELANSPDILPLVTNGSSLCSYFEVGITVHFVTKESDAAMLLDKNAIAIFVQEIAPIS